MAVRVFITSDGTSFAFHRLFAQVLVIDGENLASTQSIHGCCSFLCLMMYVYFNETFPHNIDRQPSKYNFEPFNF